MPVCSRSWNHGTMLAWCSISLTRTTSPAVRFFGAPGLGEQVEGLGRVLREDDLAGAAGGVDEARHRLARALVGGGRLTGRLVDGAVHVGVAQLVVATHGVDDGVGLQRRRGGVEVRDRSIEDHAIQLRDVGANAFGVEARHVVTARQAS